MRYISFDFEATSKYPNQARPLTLSYIVFDDDLRNIVEADTLFFWHKSFRWSNEAEAIHHMPQSMITPHEPEFYDNLRKMYTLFYKANCVGQNLKTYDCKLMEYFFVDFEYPPIIFQNQYDTMRYHGNKMTLSNICESLGFTDDYISVFHSICFPNSKFKDWKFHSSEYDAVATALIFQKMKLEGRV